MLDDRQTDGKHHQRGGVVRSPHGQECRRRHKAEDDLLPACSDYFDSSERNPFMEVICFDCTRHKECSKYQQYNMVTVSTGDMVRIQNAEHREQSNRNQRCSKNRNCFRNPENGHQQRHSGSLHPCRMHPFRRRQYQKQGKNSRPDI